MPVRRVAGLLILLCAFQSSRTFGQVVATWTSSSGAYGNSANWSTSTVPNNAVGTYYNAVINGTGADTVTFDASGTIVNSLTIGSGETFKDNGLAPTLAIGDPTFPVAGTLTNAGTVNWGNGSNLILDVTAGNGTIANSGIINLAGSTLTINSGGNRNSATLSGGGTVNLFGGTITGSSGSEVLINNDNTIQGSGMIGNLLLENSGTINANGSTPLTIAGSLGNLQPSQISSGGIVSVTGAGGLIVSGGVGNQGLITVNNSNFVTSGYGTGAASGGTLELQNGSTSTITGNVTGNDSAGQIIISSSSMNVAGDFGMYSTTVNQGTLRVQGNVSQPDSGQLTLQQGSSAIVTGSFGGGQAMQTIVNGSSLAIGGYYAGGKFGNITSLSNDAVLSVGGSVYAQPGDSFSVNSGSLASVGGDFLNSDGSVSISNSTLRVAGTLENGRSVVVGPGGILNAGNYSQQTNTYAVTDVSGTLVANSYQQGAGTTTVENGGLIKAGSFQVTGGTVNVSGLGGLIVTGGIFNAGLININNSNLVAGGYTTALVGGPGTLELQNGSTGTVTGGVTGNDSSGQIIISNSSLNVVGTFGMESTTVNQGTLRIQGDVQQPDGGLLNLQAGSSAFVTGSFGGFGQHTLIDNSSLIVQGSFGGDRFTTIDLSNAAVLSVGGSIGITAASFNMTNGSLAVTDGDFLNYTSSVSIDGSTLRVGGTFTNNGPGTVTVGTTGLLSTTNYSQLGPNSPQLYGVALTDVSGTLVATNSYQQSGGATIIEAGGLIKTGSFLATDGTVTVNGILDPTAVEIDSGATLLGTGTILGNVAMGGTIMPGAPGTSGMLTIIGNYEQIGDGIFDEQIGAPSAGFLNITGDAALDFNSYLDIILLNGYDPLGQTFNIMDYGSLVGQFSNGSSFWQDGFLWDISYGQHEIDVTAVSAPEPSSLLLLSLGLAALAFCAHKKMLTARHLA
jgi:fibronectin-binding autotransporter adhesin